MLITSRFVVLNVPKSGSSFVREVVKTIYARRAERAGGSPWLRSIRSVAGLVDPELFLRELMLPNTRVPGRPADQHGTWAQIPNRYKRLPALSVVRDPFEKHRSDYQYRWWIDRPPVPLAELRRSFPHFPNLSLDDFLRMSERTAEAKLRGPNPLNLGNLTIEFVQFFFRDPPRALRAMNDDYVASGRWRRDMADVTLLRQERLNEELAGWLGRFGFSAEEQAMCLHHPRVNETPHARAGRGEGRASWTAWGVEQVRRSERHLFAMLDQLGFRYAAPSVTTDEQQASI